MPFQPTVQSISRRQALGVLTSASALALGACSPLVRFSIPRPRVLEIDRVLHAFVATVVPGSGDSPELIRPFGDPFYSFAEWRSWFASDLCRRASRCGQPTFDLLTPRDRTAIVSAGLTSDAVTQRVYTGALFLAQVSAYVPLYEERGPSRLLGFDGAHRFRGLAAVTYPNPEAFLAASCTLDGNWN